MAQRRIRLVAKVLTRIGAGLCAGVLAGGCSQDNPIQPQTASGAGSFTISASPTNTVVQAGRSGSVDVTVNRTAGFTGVVTLSLSGLPPGVTAVYSALETTGTVSHTIATFVVEPTVTPGPYNLEINGSGGGASARAVLGLIVDQPTPDYTIEVNPNPVSILQGAGWTVQVVVATTNFHAEQVHLALANAPGGVVGTFLPDSVPGGSSTLTLAVDASVAPGSYELAVQGSGPGLPARSTPLTLNVKPAFGAVPVSLDFSECGTGRPTWLAVQDGVGSEWTPVTPSADVYPASLTQAKIGIAYTVRGARPGLMVNYLTRAEILAAQPYRFCHQAESRTVTGTAAGLAAGESAYISTGDGVSVAGSNGGFQLHPVLSGPHDLVGYKSSPAGAAPTDRFLVLRDQTPGDLAGPVDFGGANAFAPAAAPMSVVGAAGNARVTQTMGFLTGFGCDFALLYSDSPIASLDFMAYGAPAVMLRSTDFHQVVVTAADPGNASFRTVAESFHRIAPRTLALGGPLPPPGITSLAGSYLRLAAGGALPPEYNSTAYFSYSAEAGGKTHVVSVMATSDWLNGPDVSLAVPDLSGVPGFDGGAPPPPGSRGTWIFSVSGMSGASACSEGARTTTATRTGSF